MSLPTHIASPESVVQNATALANLSSKQLDLELIARGVSSKQQRRAMSFALRKTKQLKLEVRQERAELDLSDNKSARAGSCFAHCCCLNLRGRSKRNKATKDGNSDDGDLVVTEAQYVIGPKRITVLEADNGDIYDEAGEVVGRIVDGGAAQATHAVFIANSDLDYHRSSSIWWIPSGEVGVSKMRCLWRMDLVDPMACRTPVFVSE